jgi:alginate O-acetyltransferase complex protein AlgJ
VPVPVRPSIEVEQPTPLIVGARIGRGTALGLTLCFLTLIAVPAGHQLTVDLRETGRWRVLGLFETPLGAEGLKEFGEALSRDSALAASLRAGYQEVLTGLLGLGSEKIVAGRDGFLFLRKEVDMATGPGFLSRRRAPPRGFDAASRRPAAGRDPVDPIGEYARLLEARGIHLVVAPIPAKPFIEPEKVWGGYPRDAGPAWNSDRAAFLARLARKGVDVVDPTDDLWRARAGGQDLYLARDTHWTPAGLRVTAARLADHIRPLLGAVERTAFTRRPATVSGTGDLLRMLELPAGRSPFPTQTVEVVQAMDGDRFARGGDEAPVLLLGDSFTNVYSRKELEWGEGAGLGETLMLELGVAVQVIAVNGGGATLAREALAARPAALAKKKVVVWAFSSRDLADEDVSWDRVPLP